MKLPPQIKAEVFVNLLRQFEPEQDFQFVFEGDFKRNYLDDIYKIEKTGSASAASIVTLFLNRDGIYDKLPEGLFHRIDRFQKLEQSADQKAFKEEYERQKNEIAFARKFFQPFDNEFFLKSIQVEDYFFAKNGDPFTTLKVFFFGNESISSLNEEYSKRIFSFLPVLNDYKGNIIKLRFFLTTILQSNVSITQREGIKYCENKNESLTNALSKNRLNHDFYLGSSYPDFFIEWIIEIEAKKSSLSSFIGNKNFDNFISLVISFLIPAGVDVSLSIKPDEWLQLELNREKSNLSFLGYNTRI